MSVPGIENLSPDEVRKEVLRGGKFVMYLYCVSLIFVTYKRPSEIRFIKAGESAALNGLGYTVLSLIFGWWGIPWGPIYTIEALWTNLTGGRDVTPEVLNQHWPNK